MQAIHQASAAQVREGLEAGERPDPEVFRAALLDVPVLDRDVWLDEVLALGPVPDDSDELPRGGVPYLPCPVDAVLQAVDEADITAEDVVVDVGAGVGRAAALVHLLTGAPCIGLEVQRALAEAARGVSKRFPGVRLSVVHGDAAALVGTMSHGTVFFLYCPFSGERLEQVLNVLERHARARPLRVACVDLPLPALRWLEPVSAGDGAVTVYRSA